MPAAYLIGDSIAGGYAAGVQVKLAGRVAIEVRPENGEDSRRVLARLEAWLGKRRFDVIHFNCGLHDLKRSHRSGDLQVPLTEYAANLHQIIAQLRQHADQLVWACTTPVIDGQPVAHKEFARYNQDVAAYNVVADRVMEAGGVVINDLHGAVVEAGIAACVSEDGVHMTNYGYELLSRCVANAIWRTLEVAGGRA